MCWDAGTELPIHAQAPGRARWFVAGQIEAALSLGPDAALVEDARLLASELVTNAVDAGADRLLVELHVHRASLDIAVTDDAAGVPMLTHPSISDPKGRGLSIVDTIATRWGTESYPGDGKRVWARLDIDPAASADLVCRMA